VARSYGPVEDYVETLEQEIALVARRLEHGGGRRKAVHVHWGGGSPTMLSPRDFVRLMRALDQVADIGAGSEVAIEIDPRTLRQDLVAALAGAGVNRASLGVQDFDERVQRAIGRRQGYAETARAAGWLRGAGIAAINLDLMYGLPFQTAGSVAATARQALVLAPDRVALFGYAHVPWMKKHQRLLPEEALPDAPERLAQAAAAADVFLEAGYLPVGLDHFARPGDPLVARQREKRLHRNFQGYTTDEAAALIGFGTSSISHLPQGYAQNAARTVDWRDAIAAGRLATARGVELTTEDRIRQAIIERLMCDLEVDLAEVAARHHRSLADFAPELDALAPLTDRGLVRVSGGTVTVAADARPFVRHVCAVFDRYLTDDTARFSRAL
jgi:oxygen-independent coproporphyrinogen-3 oxidase